MAQAKKSAKARPKAGRSRAATAERVLKFVEAFIATDNQAEAARQAGFDPKQAAVWGYRLIKKPDVLAKIEARRAQLREQFQVTTERTIDTLASLMFFDPLDFFEADGTLRSIETVPKRARQALTAIKVRRVVEEDGDNKQDVDMIEIRFVDRVSSIEKGMRHLGMFEKDNKQARVNPITELLEYVAAHGGPIQVRPR